MNKAEISELKNNRNPPEEVKVVGSACMILLGKPTDWNQVKLEIGKSKFIESLKTYEKD